MTAFVISAAREDDRTIHLPHDRRGAVLRDWRGDSWNATRVNPLWISEADVVGLIDLPLALSAFEKTLRLEASGGAENMTKTVITFNGHDTLHAIGAAVPGAASSGRRPGPIPAAAPARCCSSSMRRTAPYSR